VAVDGGHVMTTDYRIIDIKLDEHTILWRNADIEQDRSLPMNRAIMAPTRSCSAWRKAG
jgi:hypothetical protein